MGRARGRAERKAVYSPEADTEDRQQESQCAGGFSPRVEADYAYSQGWKMKHPGFKAVQAKIAAKEGLSKRAAGAILANASRKASPAAKKANPALKKVK